MDPHEKAPGRPNASSRIVLVTGARGVLAPPVIQELQKDHSVIATDILPPPEEESANYRQADLTDFAATLDLMQGVETVVHFAITRPPPSGDLEKAPPARALRDYEKRLLEVNPLCDLNLFEAACRAGVKRFVYASSLTVYFGDKRKLQYKETDLPEPQSIYSCTKLFGESLGKVFARRRGLEVLSLRIGQPFPVGKSVDTIWQSSRRARSSYVAIQDIAQAVRCAVDTAVTQGVFNIVSASDNPRFDLTAAASIGYRPTAYFSESGLTFHPDGIFPPSDGRIVIND